MEKERNILYFESIDSTNVQAGREAANGAVSGTLVVADRQTAGRGRRGRTWESPAGRNLYFSLLLRPELAVEKASMLTLVMALAVVHALEKLTEADLSESSAKSKSPQIKWPNDIVLSGKKVCGILTEMSVLPNRIEHVIIGVGINVYQQEFAPGLADKATSLEAEWGQKLSRERLLGAVMDAFEEYYDLFLQMGDLKMLQNIYNHKLVNLNREVRVLDPKGEFTGIATGINERGELCVKLPDGQIAEVYAGEVSVRGIPGYV